MNAHHLGLNVIFFTLSPSPPRYWLLFLFSSKYPIHISLVSAAVHFFPALPFIFSPQRDRCLCDTFVPGRDLSYPSNSTILRRGLRDMGPIHHYPSRIVRLYQSIGPKYLFLGRYLLSAIPLMTVHISCSPTSLRLTNLLFSTIVTPGILSAIIDAPTHSVTASKSKRPFWRHMITPSASALVISSFPLIFFFGNLYYTDVASLAGVLGAYALALHGQHWAASLVSHQLPGTGSSADMTPLS